MFKKIKKYLETLNNIKSFKINGDGEEIYEEDFEDLFYEHFNKECK